MSSVLLEENNGLIAQNNALLRQVAQLQAEVERLRAALDFYANSVNWRNDVVDIGVGSEEIPGSNAVSFDGGETAREALKGSTP